MDVCVCLTCLNNAKTKESRQPLLCCFSKGACPVRDACFAAKKKSMVFPNVFPKCIYIARGVWPRTGRPFSCLRFSLQQKNVLH